MSGTTWVWLVIGVLAVASPRARADGNDDVLAVGGTAEARDLATIEGAVTGVLHDAAWQLPARPLSKHEIAGLLRCLDVTDDTCIPDSVHARGVHEALVVLAAKAQATDGTNAVILTGKLLALQPVAYVVRQRRCEPCTDDSLKRASTGLAQELLDELSVRIGRTLIVITTVPEGAHVSLDGRAVGATNMNIKTFPGTHAVELDKAGFATVTRSIRAEDGKTAEVAVTLRPADATPPHLEQREPARAGARWWPGIGFLAGGALAAAGGVALVVLGREDGPDDRYRYRHATVLGAGVLLAGLAAAGYGAYRLTVEPAPGGAIAGVEGSF